MIKKILFIASLFCVGFVSAQSFQLLDYNGLDISNTNHYEYGTPAELGLTGFQIENLTGFSKSFSVKAERVYYDGEEIFGCNNLQVCYDAACHSLVPSISGVQVVNNGVGDVVAANSTYIDLKISPITACWNDCANDSAVWIVTIYDAANPTDEVSATIVWRCGAPPVSVNEISNEYVRLNAFPNPALSDLNISYSIDASFDNAIIDVYDMLGKKMISKELNRAKGQVNLDVEPLDAGVYFYAIKIDGQTIRTERVVVR
jgi:hypothetical protein